MYVDLRLKVTIWINYSRVCHTWIPVPRFPLRRFMRPGVSYVTLQAVSDARHAVGTPNVPMQTVPRRCTGQTASIIANHGFWFCTVPIHSSLCKPAYCVLTTMHSSTCSITHQLNHLVISASGINSCAGNVEPEVIVSPKKCSLSPSPSKSGCLRVWCVAIWFVSELLLLFAAACRRPFQ